MNIDSWDHVSTIIQGLCMIAIVGITAVTAVYSSGVAESNKIMAEANAAMAEEAKLMREEQFKPFVAALVVKKEGMAYQESSYWLVIRNDGAGRAFNIELTTDLDLIAERSMLDENGKYANFYAPWFVNGIPYLAPNFQAELLLFPSQPSLSHPVANPFNVTVSYESESGKRVNRSFLIDAKQHGRVRQDIGDLILQDIKEKRSTKGK